MDTFTLVKSSLAATADDPDREGLDRNTRDTGRILAAVQTVVDVLTPPDGGRRYIVGFVDMATAATDLTARRIIVSSKPLHDRNLTLIEKAVVIVTFAAHEIGHTIITAPRAAMIREHNPKSGYHAVANLADDIILEPFMADRYPILQDAFAFTGHWVLRTTAKDLPKREHGNWDSTASRFNTLLSATRYGDIPEIVWATRKARDERDWGRGWAARLIAADTRDHATFLALCDEAWVRIRTKDDDDEVEAPPVTDGPTGPSNEPPQPGDDDEDGPDSQPGEGEDEDGPDPSQRGIEDDDESDDDDGEGEGEGEDEGEDGDESDDATDGGDDATDDDGEDGDDDGDESDGTDDGGESTDWGDESDEHGEDGDDGDGSDDEGLDDDGDTPRGDNGEGGGGDADASADDDLRDEDDFNADDVDDNTHSEAHAEPWDYGQRDDEEAVRAYQNTGTTAFGRHGKMTTTWS